MIIFFSSRRRHTRFDCDWSSDVCSSDLLAVGGDQATRRRGSSDVHSDQHAHETARHDRPPVWRSWQEACHAQGLEIRYERPCAARSPCRSSARQGRKVATTAGFARVSRACAPRAADAQGGMSPLYTGAVDLAELDYDLPPAPIPQAPPPAPDAAPPPPHP